MSNSENNKPIDYKIIIVALSIGLSAIFLTLKSTDQNSHIPYQSAEINYNNNYSHNIRKFAITKGGEKFLFAASTPANLDLALNFLSSEIIQIKIKPLYPNWICDKQAIGKSVLSLKSNSIDKNWQLISGKNIDLDINVRIGDSVNVSLINSYQQNCGRAEITLSSTNHIKLYYSLFLIIWLLIFLALHHFGFSLSLGVFGIALNCLIVFANSTLSLPSLNNLVSTSIQSLFIVGALLLIQCVISNRITKHILTTVLITSVSTVLMLYIGHSWVFGSPVTADTIHAIIQSDLREILEFCQSVLGLWKLFLVAGIILLTVIFVTKLNRKTSNKYWSALILSCLMILPLSFTHISKTNNTPMWSLFKSAQTEYFEELNTFRLLNESRTKDLSLSDISLAKTNQILVVVIGESANKNHMSLYGYPRDTTPHATSMLYKEKLIRFDRAYANDIHTNGALANALTKADQYSNKKWMTSPSLLGMANSLGIMTSWITNQQLLGAWDNHVSVLAQEAINVVRLNKKIGVAKNSDKYDEVLLSDLEISLNDNNHAKLIFLHLQGSHVSYCKRFPISSAKYQDSNASKSEFGALATYINRTNKGAINCYDNSILYTDKLINQIVDLLQKQKKSISMLYFSDHSEDVLNNKAHNTALFTFAMTEIPMFFWASDSWKVENSMAWSNLENNKSKTFTNDHIFETISGLLGIVSTEIDSSNDLSSDKFSEVSNPLTLLGRKSLIDKDNWHYWQQSNTNQIVNKGECSRLIPHRANSLGKIRSAISDGLCGFEIDVHLKTQESSTVFSVGHDRNTMTDNTLEEVLQNIPFDSIDKIWLDVKNLNILNISGMIERLDYLDNKYNLKAKAIIETGYFGEDTKEIVASGYRLSYYLPTSTVIKAMNENSSEQSEIAQDIENKITKMNASEISFDLKLYPFVKKYLEPLIEAKIRSYHTWFPVGISVTTSDLYDQLSSKSYYKDKRVKTILLRYNSPFNI